MPPSIESQMTKLNRKIIRLDKDSISKIVTRVDTDNPVLENDKAEMAIPSYLNRNPLIQAIFWRRYDRVYRLAELMPEMTVAEFGCGIGAFLPTLAKETAKVYAIDLFPQYAQEMAEEHGLDITFSTSLDVIPDDSLDVLFAVEVLEHLDDLAAGIRHIARKIKPGGKLIMSGPTESALYKIGRFMVGYNKYHEYHRHNVYNIRQAIVENGFNLEKTIRFPGQLVLLNLICLFQVEK